MEGRIKKNHRQVLEHSEQVRSKFQRQAKSYRICLEKIKKNHSEAVKRQSQFGQLLNADQKVLSAFFMKYQPMSFNQVKFNDLQSYGGPKIAFDMGKMYIGTIVNGKRHGKGIIVCPKGKVYEGQMLNNERSGVGVQIYEGGNFYWGGFRGNKHHGRGIMVWVVNNNHTKQPTFQYYSGQWKDGESQGFGMHSSQSGQYIGSFKTGFRSGKGMESQGDRIFQGQFVNGLRQGSGFYCQKNGEVYDGEYKLGIRHGYGRWQSLKTNQIYEGFFQNDKKDGIGLYQRPNGFTYRGMFTDDKPNGTGQVFRGKGNRSRSTSREKQSKVKVSLRQTVELKSAQITKEPFLVKKPSEQLATLKKGKLFGSVASIRQRPPLATKRKHLMSARLNQQSKRLSSQSGQKKCTHRTCSCNNWEQKTSKVSTVDQSRIKRLFSSRKLMLKQVT